MNYTASDNFKIWYLSADPNPNPDIMLSRIEIIKQNIGDNRELEFWFDLVKLYLDMPITDKTNVEAFIKTFSDNDETFPTSNNENLVRCLASITLCFQLELLDNNRNNLISLAILNSNFLGQYHLYNTIPVVSYASQYLLNSSISVREIDSEKVVLNLNNIPQTLKDDSFLPINEAIRSIIPEVAMILQMNKALAEENNILWWLFGEYSKTYNRLFGNINIHELIVVAAKELSAITAFDSGVGSAEQILNKVLHSGRSTKSEELSLLKVIEALPQEMKNELKWEHSAKVSEFTPCIIAIKESIDAPNDKNWSNIYRERYSNGEVNKFFSPLSLSIQFYREFLFLKNLKVYHK